MDITNDEKNIKRGGARSNCGRKFKYGEKTEVYQIRLPVSKIQGIKRAVQILLTDNWLEQFLHECDNKPSL